MPTIIQNLNSILTTKSELNSIIQENGYDPGEVFSNYPSYIRSIIESGGNDKVSYAYLAEVLEDYTTYSYTDENYVTYTYFYSYLSEWGSYAGEGLVDRVFGLEEKTTQLDNRTYDLEDYCSSYNSRISGLEHAGYQTSSQVSNSVNSILNNGAYINQTALSSNSYASTSYVVDYVQTYAASTVDLTNYVTKNDLDTAAYISEIPSYYVTQAELSANGYITNFTIPSTYATYTAISEMGYITQANISSMSYITMNDIDACSYATQSYVVDYVDTHTSGGGGGDTSGSIIPSVTNTYTLGNESYMYKAAYINRVNIGTNKVYIYNNGDTQMKFGVNGADRFRIDYNSFVPSISNVETQLGASNNLFTYTYTSYLYTLVDGTLTDIGYYISYNMGDIETLLANI